MARMRGGSPKNMRQGQYWVRRNLDDQRRTARAAHRLAVPEAVNGVGPAKALMQAVAVQERELLRLERQKVAVQRQLDLSRHFQKVQAEVRRAIAAVGGTEKGEALQLSFDTDEEMQNLLTELVTAYQSHADHLNEVGTTSATTLSKHVANAKKMLVAIGRAKKVKTRWSAAERRLTFGELSLDFGEPEPMHLEEWTRIQESAATPTARRPDRKGTIPSSSPIPRSPSSFKPYKPAATRSRYQVGSHGGRLLALCLIVALIILAALVVS